MIGAAVAAMAPHSATSTAASLVITRLLVRWSTLKYILFSWCFLFGAFYYFSSGANATLIELNPHWLFDPETREQFRDF